MSKNYNNAISKCFGETEANDVHRLSHHKNLIDELSKIFKNRRLDTFINCEDEN